MKLAMEIFFDEETGQWGYSVPALAIVGTGCKSKEEARRLGYQAIESTLEPGREQASSDGEIVMFNVEVTPDAETG